MAFKIKTTGKGAKVAARPVARKGTAAPASKMPMPKKMTPKGKC